MPSGENSEFSHFYDKYTSINKRLLRSVGLWPQIEGEEDPLWKRALTIFYILLLVSLTLSEFYHVYLIWGSFFDILEILCNTTTSILISHKAITFYFKRDVIVDFCDQTRKMWAGEFENPSNRQIMIDSAKAGQTLTRLFLVLVIFTLTNFFLAPAVSIFYQWKSGTPSAELTLVLPYLVKLPLDLHQPLQHLIGYIPIIIVTVTLTSYIAGVDSFYFTSIQHLVLHLNLLQRSLTKLRFGQLDETESPLDRLHSCIEKHKAIIKHSEVLEEIYSPIILGLGVISTLSMCMVIFHAVVTKGGHNGNVALFFMYLAMEVSEVLLYCWFGSALIYASLEVGSALYESDWYDADRDRKAVTGCIRIMMIRSQKPIKLTACNFADVSLRLFTSIMSSTASYFALLRHLYTN